VDPDRLHAVIVEEMARRRAEVIAIDVRLATLADRVIDFVSDGGKRIRPEFLWCGWLAAGGRPGPSDELPDGPPDHPPDDLPDDLPDDTPVLQVAAALELIQACALIHDDVIDRSERRRGSPSTHRAVAKEHADAGLSGDAEHYGLSAAVLLGDLALAWADDLYTAGAQALDAVDRSQPVWRAMRTEVLAGQLLDLITAARTAAAPWEQAADAMRVNRFKTAAYTVERPLHLGAALAGAGAATIEALRTYGADIGVAFQLRDDLLGVYGDPEVTGKPAGDDLLEGKRTLLLATARAALHADPELLAELDAGIGNPRAPIRRLAAIIAATGAPQQMEGRIDELVACGLDALAALDEDGRPAVAPAARARLTELAGIVTDRRR